MSWSFTKQVKQHEDCKFSTVTNNILYRIYNFPSNDEYGMAVRSFAIRMICNHETLVFFDRFGTLRIWELKTLAHEGAKWS